MSTPRQARSSAARLPRLRRALHRRRRWLAAGATAAAVTAGLDALAPPPQPTTPVVVAARPVAAGQQLAATDLRTAPFPRALVPDGALRSAAEAVDQRAAVPLRPGEPVTDVRLVGPSLVPAGSGLVEAAVRVADPALLATLRTGDRVDVLAVVPGGSLDSSDLTGGEARPPPDPEPLTRAAPVLAVLAEQPSTGGSRLLATDQAAAVVVLAVPPRAARRMAVAGARGELVLARAG